MNRKYFINCSLISFSAAILTSCMTVGPEYTPPEIEGRQDAWLAGDSSVLAPGAVQGSDWWQVFDDPMLNRLIAEVSDRNINIAQAETALTRASATMTRANRSVFPMGGVSGSVTRQQQSTASFGADLPFEFEEQTNYNAGANLSWESGLFGRIKSGLAQAETALGGQEAMLEDTRRVVLAQAATTYFSLLELDHRIAVSESNLERQREVFKLTEQLRDAGEVSDIDVERQSNLIDSTLSAQTALKSARQDILGALALLTGRTLPEFMADYPELTTGDVPDYVGATAFGPLHIISPEDMLRRRPDIRAAERQLAGSVYAVQFATADLYPQLTLSGNVSVTALEPGDLFSGDALGYSFGPKLSWSLFNRGAIKAAIEETKADSEAARLNFENTVLTALTETDTALQSYNFGVEQAAISKRALGSAERSRDLVEIRYREGAESLLSLIEAQRQALAAQDAELQARYEALRRRVTVYRALGG